MNREHLNPLQWPKALGRFTKAWISSMPLRRLAAGVPVLVVGIAIGVLALLSFSQDGGFRRVDYRHAVGLCGSGRTIRNGRSFAPSQGHGGG